MTLWNTQKNAHRVFIQTAAVWLQLSWARQRKRISELAALDGWFPSLLLVWVVSHILHDCFQTQPGLLCSGDNLGSWKEEPIATRVSQLEGKWVFDAIIIAPVNAASAGLVWKRKGEKTEDEQRIDLSSAFIHLYLCGASMRFPWENSAPKSLSRRSSAPRMRSQQQHYLQIVEQMLPTV